jgi:hypothetical protein
VGDLQLVELPDKELKSSWQALVKAQCRGRCVNCGETRHVRVHMVVPEEAGGKFVLENGIVLCRACEFARMAAASGKQKASRLVNFYASALFYRRMERLKIEGQTSLSAIIRSLMRAMVDDPESYEDIAQYQDSGQAQTRLNVWVDLEQYSQFQELVEARGMTVTDAVKGLLLMYAANRLGDNGEQHVE